MSYRDIKINLDYIMQFDPCESGVNEYVNAGYKDFNGDIFDFLSLEKISVSNRLWVVLRPEIISENDLHELSCKFAENVLHIFEDKYPDDDRPRKAIQAKRDYIAGKISRDELRNAGDAARSAWSAWSAWGAARSAAWATWSAWDAASAAASDAARAAEEKKQIKIVLEYLKDKK